MSKKVYNYFLGMMPMIFPADFNPVGTTIDPIFKEWIGQKVVNEMYYLVILIGCRLHVVLMCWGGTRMKQARAIKHSKIGNTLPELVQRTCLLTTEWNYPRARWRIWNRIGREVCELSYQIHFPSYHMVRVIKIKKLCNVRSLHYFCQATSEKRRAAPSSGDVECLCNSWKDLCISHIDNSVLYSLKSDEVNLMNETVDNTIKNPTKAPPSVHNCSISQHNPQ